MFCISYGKYTVLYFILYYIIISTNLQFYFPLVKDHTIRPGSFVTIIYLFNRKSYAIDMKFYPHKNYVTKNKTL